MKRMMFLTLLFGMSWTVWAIPARAPSSSSSSAASSGGSYSLGGGGEYAIGLMGGTVNSSQDDLNALNSRANQRVGGISTKQLNSAYEIAGFLMHRFPGSMFALQLRPSYFYQAETGSGTGGDFNYSVKGFTVFPIARIYPLENDMMKVYLQAGLGYGQLDGEIIEAGAIASFSGSTFGSMIGLGVELCASASHCFNFEGNYRYMTFDRNIVSNSTGTYASGSLSQYGVGQELEIDNHDLATRMGGLVLMAGYTFWF
jgi:hypothetical protein